MTASTSEWHNSEGAIMKRSLLTLAGCAALLGGPGAAQAGTDVGQWTLGAGGLWTGVDSDRDLDNAIGFYANFGRAMSERWDAGVSIFQSNHDNHLAPGDREIKGFTFDASRVFNRDQRFSPFITMGMGMVDAAKPGKPDNEVAAKLGIGALADLVTFSSGNKLQLRLDAGVRKSIGRPYVDVLAGLGLQLALGGERAAPVPPPPPPPPPPAPQAAPPPPPPPPADDDKDGVVNTADRCPSTPAGDKVDSVGCSLTVRLEVYFDTNSDQIKPESYPDLDRVVEFMTRTVPSASGVVEGHTDSVGDDAYNLKLSQRRADAVRKYLVDKGVPSSRLEARGFGEAQPVADNKTADGRAQNRRVVLTRNDVK
jgi:OOP family OmpA-OmpF porin